MPVAQRLATLLTTIATIFVSRHLLAGDSFVLEWYAPPGCPTESAIRARIEALVADRAETEPTMELSAVGTVRQTSNGFRLTLETEQNGVAGERQIDGATCTEVALAGSLVIALAIDPEAQKRAEAEDAPATAAFEPAESPPVEATPTKPPQNEPTERPAREPSRKPERAVAPPGVAVGVFGALDSASLPAVAGGVGLRTALLLRGFRFAADAAYLPPRFGAAEGYGDKGGEFSLLFVGASACFAPWDDRFAAGVCGLVETGALFGTGVRISNGRSETEPWLAGGAAGMFEARLTERLSAGLRVGAVVPVGRPSFGFGDETGRTVEAHRPKPVGFRATLGLDVRLF